jgi:cell division protein FtsB
MTYTDERKTRAKVQRLFNEKEGLTAEIADLEKQLTRQYITSCKINQSFQPVSVTNRQTG